MKTWPDATIYVNHIKLHYYRTGGDKPVVILAHGITDNGLCWTRLAQALADQFDLIMVDARGHGLSDKPERGYSPEDQAHDLAGLIEALDLRQPAVVGHSMGAVVAAVLADMHPNYVGRLVLEDPAWYPQDDDIPEEENLQHIREWAKAIDERKMLSIEEILTKARQDNPLWDEAEFPAFAQAKRQVSPNVTQYNLAPDSPWWDIVPSLSCPVLLLTGDTEGQVAINEEIAQDIHNLNSAIQIERLTGAGHNVRREAFAAYLRLVRAFLGQS